MDDTILASYFAARDARVRAAMVLFNRKPTQFRSTAVRGGMFFSAAFGFFMLAPFVMIGSQVAGIAMFMFGCIFFFVGMEMLTHAGTLADGQLALCFKVVDSEHYHPEFIAAMQKHVRQRIEEEWDPIVG